MMFKRYRSNHANPHQHRCWCGFTFAECACWPIRSIQVRRFDHGALPAPWFFYLD